MTQPTDAEFAARAREWVDFARGDRKSIDKLVDDADTLLQAAFHAQQAVEKLLKALLLAYGADPDEHHNIGQLVNQVDKLDRKTARALGAVERLTQYAALRRYPPRPGKGARSLEHAAVRADISVATAACDMLEQAILARASVLDARSAAVAAPASGSSAAATPSPGSPASSSRGAAKPKRPKP